MHNMLATVGRWLRGRWPDLRRNHVLRHYAAALALVNVAAGAFWLRDFPLGALLSPEVAPVCWPVFAWCDALRVLSPPTWTAMVAAFTVASVFNTLCFFWPRAVPVATAALAALTVFKLLLVFQDFRLTLNHHYMAGWIAVVFFLARSKEDALENVLVAMYVIAATIKLTPSAEWLSGEAFYGRLPLGVPAQLIGWARAYVVALELFVVFGLKSRRPWLFGSSLAQFFVFHLVSYGVVGWFYPAIMFLLLSIFPIRFALQEAPTWRSSVQRSLAWVLLLILAQLPKAVFAGSSAITGEGRLFALNMFDSPVECRAYLANESIDRGAWQRLRPPGLNTRTMCDPIVYRAIAEAACLKSPDAAVAPAFRLFIETRRTSERRYRVLVDIPQYCGVRPSYSVLRHNRWIAPLD